MPERVGPGPTDADVPPALAVQDVPARPSEELVRPEVADQAVPGAAGSDRVSAAPPADHVPPRVAGDDVAPVRSHQVVAGALGGPRALQWDGRLVQASPTRVAHAGPQSGKFF